MTGLGLLLQDSLRLEHTHQIVLFSLLQNSELAEYLLGHAPTGKVEWEPEKGLFDLAVPGKSGRTLLELKVGSALGNSQLERQTQYTARTGDRPSYVLLGTSWYECDERHLQAETKGRGLWIGYEELIRALARLVQAHQTEDVRELALAYKEALASEFKALQSAAVTAPETRDKRFFYSLYWTIKSRLRNSIDLSIYTSTNRGGQVYILNDGVREPLRVGPERVEVYFEVADGRPCLKFTTECEDNENKGRIRAILREAAHEVLDGQVRLVDEGRFGKHMTFCRLDQDLLDLSSVDRSCNLMGVAHSALPSIASAAERKGRRL